MFRRTRSDRWDHEYPVPLGRCLLLIDPLRHSISPQASVGEAALQGKNRCYPEVVGVPVDSVQEKDEGPWEDMRA